MLRKLKGALRRHLPRGDAGSMLPMIVVCVLIVVLMIMGMTTATAAFLAQRNIQSICDSAATWAAAEADSNKVLTNKGSSEKFLPLSPEAVASAVEEHRTRFYADDRELQMAASSDGETLTVECHTKVKVPFGSAFGKGDGIGRDAVSVVRSPVSDSSPQAPVVDNSSTG